MIYEINNYDPLIKEVRRILKSPYSEEFLGWNRDTWLDCIINQVWERDEELRYFYNVIDCDDPLNVMGQYIEELITDEKLEELINHQLDQIDDIAEVIHQFNLNISTFRDWYDYHGVSPRDFF